ncbi:MAG: response regulator [Prevotellaceae bacterium]|jgi:signal transduction histidine kinase/CheY-like chemotaxis protein|nr:response regulator [Prevotellaceae bacterium]
MKKSIEHRIRAKAVLGYLLVPVACIGMVLYIYHLDVRIDRQKQNVEHHNLILSLTDDLTASVQQAQSAANLYLFSSNPCYFQQFQKALPAVGQQIDSLISLSSDSMQFKTLHDIVLLLQKKEVAISKLAGYFSRYDSADTLVGWLQSYTPPVTTDSVVVTVIHQDTLVQEVEQEESKKSFWQKIGNIFSSSPSPPPGKEVYHVVTTMQTNTLRNVAVDTLSMLSTLSGMWRMSEQTSKGYARRLKSIERQVNQLVAADQEVSQEISALLIKLHRQTLDSALGVIQKNKQQVESNYLFSVVVSVVLSLLVLLFVLMIIVDVNKSYSTRSALEEEKKRTEELMNSRHNLLLSVSHDIKAPLTSMLGYMELWKDEKLPPKQQQQLASMQSSGTYILLLLNNLLNFSGLEQGKLQLNRNAFDVQELCHEVVAMFAPLAMHRGLAFEHKCGINELRYITSDRLKLKQIIVNLVSNSVKYTPKGKVTLSAWEDGSALRFKVEDTGIGIPEAKIENLFKPFLQVETGRPVVEGSGMGMFVVKGLLEILQGEICIRSQEDLGTQVEFTLPVEKASAAMVELQKAPEVAAAGKIRRALVVDDDAALLVMLEEMQRRLGNTVATCQNWQEFEEQLPLLADFDMVLTDMNMKNISGKDILLKVREASPFIPVFVMTAHSDFSHEKAIAEGFDGYLPKPFSMSLLAGLPEKRAADESLVPPPVDGGVASLLDFFGGDREAAAEVVKVFVADTARNLSLLRRHVKKGDFRAAQALCHKMLPMFAQLRLTDLTELPEKMDRLRGKSPKHFPEWQEKTLTFADEAEKRIGSATLLPPA